MKFPGGLWVVYERLITVCDGAFSAAVTHSEQKNRVNEECRFKMARINESHNVSKENLPDLESQKKEIAETSKVPLRKGDIWYVIKMPAYMELLSVFSLSFTPGVFIEEIHFVIEAFPIQLAFSVSIINDKYWIDSGKLWI